MVTPAAGAWREEPRGSPWPGSHGAVDSCPRAIMRPGARLPSPLLKKNRETTQDRHHDGLEVEGFHIGTYVRESAVCG
jgi:hypothetical protein